MKGETLRVTCMLAMGLALIGCSTAARRVDCDKQLIAINPPAPLTHPLRGQASTP
jgi:hypothetical protein